MSDCRKCAKFEECAVDEDCGLFVEKPLSNGDVIRSKSDYDLADWIANILMCHGAFARSEDFDFDRYCADCPLDKCCNDQPSDNIEDWLKAPADKEDTNGETTD